MPLPDLTVADTLVRTNIIFLLSDDQGDGTFGAMGHPFVQTPNTDKLIRGVVRFANTYIASPVCAQSRVSLLRGCLSASMVLAFLRLTN